MVILVLFWGSIILKIITLCYYTVLNIWNSNYQLYSERPILDSHPNKVALLCLQIYGNTSRLVIANKSRSVIRTSCFYTYSIFFKIIVFFYTISYRMLVYSNSYWLHPLWVSPECFNTFVNKQIVNLCNIHSQYTMPGV